MKMFIATVIGLLLMSPLSLSQGIADSEMPKYRPAITERDQVLADGTFSQGEWDAIIVQNTGWVDDLPGRDGVWYFMVSTGYKAGNNSFQGLFGYQAHNIDGLVVDQTMDYNVFEVEIYGYHYRTWVFEATDTPPGDDMIWLLDSGIRELEDPEFKNCTQLVDTGFLVYCFETMDARHFRPDIHLSPQQDPNYDWEGWFGFYGAQGFDNSAFEEGLPLADDGPNEIYEVVFKVPPYPQGGEFDLWGRKGAGQVQNASTPQMPIYLGFGKWLIDDKIVDSSQLLIKYNEGEYFLDEKMISVLYDDLALQGGAIPTWK